VVDTVRIRLVGGLGNQLFGYAAGSVLADSLGASLELDTSWTRHGITDHGIPIRDFQLAGRWLPDDRVITRLLRPGTFRGRAAAAIEQRLRRIGLLSKAVASFSTPIIKEKWSGRRLHLRGYFQDVELAQQFLCQNKGTLDLLHPSDWYLNMCAAADTQRPIGVHVRLGDYLSLADGQALTGDYYQRAITEARMTLGDRPLWLFTDSPNEAQRLAPALASALLVQSPIGTSAAEEMLLFSAMSGHVIANSTFSWWGAFLSKGSDGVWYPSPWFDRGTPANLISPNWRSVDSEHLHFHKSTASK